MLNQGVWNSLGCILAYMGYQGATSGDVNVRGTATGYPACLQDNSPAGCPGTVAVNNYWKCADNNCNCSINKFVNGTWVWRSGCDVGEGMSGGPFYYSSTRSLLGHVTWQACTTCQWFGGAGTIGVDAITADDFYSPNNYVGMDDWLFGEQNRLRNAYP